MTTSTGRKISCKRKEMGKTQMDFFFKLKGLGLKQSFATFVKWELGRSSPGISELKILSEALEVNVDYFFKD
jgi:transcriptional regulator with XRE-family HTH domain